ncbi:MAG: hypothetical protein J6I56_05655, partial [Lachnospiraceae bacterium]|nr:hypothetical protein [Lachnospiraceae bacterium]
GITGVMSMHVLSTLLLALLIPLLCVVLCRKTFTKPVFFPLLKALVLTIALNLHFMVPVLDYLLHQPMKGTGEGYPLWNNATDVVELFINAADPEHISGGWAGAGIVSFCVLMLALFLLLRGQAGIFRKEIRFLSVAAVLLLFISTKAFPYYAIRENLPFLYRIIFNIQFPWHFLNPALAVLALLFVLVLCAVKESRGESEMQAALVILCLISCAQSWLFLNNVAENGRTIAMYDAASLPSGNGDEFMIPDASLSLPYTATSVAISDPGAGHADQVTRRGLSVSARLTNDSDREVYALFPLWAYRYMTAVDESGASLSVREADDHRLAVLLPAGFDGTVTASFREPLHWRAAQILSLAALIWVALRLAASRRRGLSAAD